MMRKRRDGEEPSSSSEGFVVPEDVPKDAIIFHFSRFQQNARIFAMLAPTIFVLLMFGGRILLGTATAGLLITYMLDFNGFQESTLVAIWLTVFASIVELVVSSLPLFRVSVFNVALVYNMLLVCTSLGLWATLQFQFLQRSSPRLVLVLERLLFTILPTTPSIVIVWGLIAVYGVENAPYFALFVMGAGYYLFVLPVKSSFALPRDGVERKSAAEEEDNISGMINGRLESAIHTCGMILVPAMLHVGINHTHLLATNSDIASLGLLIALPLLYVFLLTPKGSLWWAGFSDSGFVAARKFIIVLLMFVVVTCLEIRVIFHAFSDYIHLSPPLNYIVVTLGLYCIVALFALHFLNLISEGSSLFLTFLAVGGAIGLSFAIGLPFWILPFGVIAAVYFARFYFSNLLVDYIGFVCGAFVVVFWFVHKTFMFLDFEFTALPMSIFHVALILVFMFLATLLIPGLIVASANPTINGIILCFHASLFTLLEVLMFQQFTNFYPIYLVVLTSILGILLAFRLEQKHRITDIPSQVMASIYLSKLGMLTYPAPYGVVSFLLLTLVACPFSHFYWTHKQNLAGSVSRSKAMTHVALIFAAAFVTRHTLLAAFMQSLLEHTPSESSLLALVLLTWAVACFPFATAYFKNSMEFKRVLAAALGGSCALIFVQPDMEWIGPFLSLNGIPHEVDEAGPPSWSGWCAVAAVVLPLLALTSPHLRSTYVRILLSLASGACGGMFFCGTYLEEIESPLLYVLFSLSFALLALFITFTLRPSVRSHEYLVFVFAGFLALFPAMFVLDIGGGSGHSFSLRRRQEDQEQLRTCLLAVYSVLLVVVAFVVRMRLHLSSEAVQVKNRPLHVRGAMNSALNHAWLPTVGNISVVSSFLLALVLCIEFLGQSETCVFFLAPLLLLLSPDPGLFRWLSEKNRYFPIIFVTSAFLTAVVVFNITLRPLLESRRWISASLVPHPESENLFVATKNLALLALTTPSHVIFNKFLWDFRRQSTMLWIALLPLNLVPMFLADSSVIVVLALLAVLFGCTQMFLSHRIHMHGMQFI